MSRAFSQAKPKGEERRAILQAIQTQMRASHHRRGDQVRKRVSGAGSHDQARTPEARIHVGSVAKLVRSTGSVAIVAVGRPTTSHTMVMIGVRERSAGSTSRGCKSRGFSTSAGGTMWSAPLRSWRSTSAFGSICISTGSLAAGYVKAYASFRQAWSALLGSSVGLRTIVVPHQRDSNLS